jgi:hypothetical protein
MNYGIVAVCPLLTDDPSICNLLSSDILTTYSASNSYFFATLGSMPPGPNDSVAFNLLIKCKILSVFTAI